MMKFPRLDLFIVFVILMASCAAPAAEEVTEEAAVVEEEASVDVALKVTGLVVNEMGWSEEEVKGMETISIEATNKNGDLKTYDGVLINSLLELAEPNAEATTIVFVADDGYTIEVPLVDVAGCTDCIVSFRDQGGFSTVLPGFESSMQVKGVVEIQIK